jgi:aminopeptidase N
MIFLLLLLQTAQPHDALHYDITLIPSDTSAHVLGEVQITWRLGSTKPVTMELDSAMRVIRVLVDGKPNTRLSRTMYARSSTEIEVPHGKQPGDSISTRVRYRGSPRGGLISGKDTHGDRMVSADNRPGRMSFWLPTPASPEDSATVSFHLQVPAAYKVSVPGKLEKIDTLAYGNVMWNYAVDRPVAVYTIPVSWVAGPAESKSVRSKK